jgi:HD-GYP domain-containing protein (c-di-GMP phosphodiesterase class II)
MIKIYNITALMGFFTSISLGLFVLYKNPRKPLNIRLCLLNLAISCWAGFLFLMNISWNKDVGVFASRALHMGAIIIPVLFLHFILTLINEDNRHKQFLLFSYAITFIFILLNFSSLIIKTAIPKSPFPYYPEAGILYPFYLFLFFGLTSYAVYRLFLSYKISDGIKKIQYRYALIASLIGFFTGSSTYLYVYNIPIEPFGIHFFFVYPIVVSYSILRYRFINVEVIIRETVVYAGVFGFSIGIFVLAMMVGQQALLPYIGEREWLLPAIALLVVTIVLRPIEKIIYNTVGKILFKKRYTHQKTLQDAATGMATIRDPRKLVRLIVHIISMKMRFRNVAILIYDEDTHQYHLRASRGEDKFFDYFTGIREDEPIIDWLREKREPIVIEDLQIWLDDGCNTSNKSILAADLMRIKEQMEKLRAAVCVPSFYRDELLGILVLGEKKTGEFFSTDELKLLNTLADEAAIALKNSQLYFEIDKRAGEIEELYKREHKLFMHASVAFAAAIDARDPYTHGHSERVTNFSLAILDYMGHNDEVDKNPLFRQRLQIGAVLHDIGKIGVSDDILHKPGKLDAEEQKEMEKHPVIGSDIVSHIKGLRDILGGVKYHHERYDGKGYPEGLKSDHIPIMARIIAIADTYDAMTSDRPYRKGLSDTIAREEIKNNGSTQFDPFIVAAFLKASEASRIKPDKGLRNNTNKKKPKINASI